MKNCCESLSRNHIKIKKFVIFVKKNLKTNILKIKNIVIRKEIVRIDKNGEEITKTISYRLRFISSTRFMASSLSNIVNLAEGTHKIKYEYKHDDKICEICEIKYKDCDYFLQYTNFKDDLIDYKCLCCKKNLKKQFFNRYKFSINKFILML